MSAVDFLDTNVLVYSMDARDRGKQALAQRIVTAALADRSATISFQVVQESLHALTRKTRRVLAAAGAEEFLHAVLLPLWHIQPSPALYERALQVQEKQQLSFHDSLVVAAALEAGCKRLLTEDLQHGQKIGPLRIENPFR